MPHLIVEDARCSHCLAAVEYSDGLPYCTDCLIAWDNPEDGALAHVDVEAVIDPTDLCQHPAPVGRPDPYSVVVKQAPCPLPTGHTGLHYHPPENQ